MEKAAERLSDDLDACDLITVLMVILDADGSDLHTALSGGDGISIVRDLVSATQSNPLRAINRLKRFARLDEAILDTEGY